MDHSNNLSESAASVNYYYFFGKTNKILVGEASIFNGNSGCYHVYKGVQNGTCNGTIMRV